MSSDETLANLCIWKPRGTFTCGGCSLPSGYLLLALDCMCANEAHSCLREFALSAASVRIEAPLRSVFRSSSVHRIGVSV